MDNRNANARDLLKVAQVILRPMCSQLDSQHLGGQSLRNLNVSRA